jgi:hypothetical protein
MPCACARCLEDAKTLGLVDPEPPKSALRKAYKAAAKIWHPDRFEGNPDRRREAEERFKEIQLAYRQLWDHWERPEVPVSARGSAQENPEHGPLFASLFFANLPGCYAGPYFPPGIREIVSSHLEEAERALALVDLPAEAGQDHAQYILLTSYRIVFRNAVRIISVLWYTDLGEVLCFDRAQAAGLLPRIVGAILGRDRRFVLQVDKYNGSRFLSLEGEADDSVKKVLYNFLLQMKQQQRP